jgi:hypothetical protein
MVGVSTVEADVTESECVSLRFGVSSLLFNSSLSSTVWVSFVSAGVSA